MARFTEESPDAVPLHTLGKEWAHVFVSDGAVFVQHVKRSAIAGHIHGQHMPMTPEKADLLIKALKRAIKEAKRSGRGGNN